MEELVFKDIIYEKKEGIAKITINRPHAYNAFTSNTLRELALAFEDADRDPAVGVVVLIGAGDKAFCSGGDLKEAAQPGGYNRENDYWHSRLHHSIRSTSKPTVAAVNGYAIGGGHILHLLCDISIASENAKFGQAGPEVGSFDAGFGASFLARCLGEKKAFNADTDHQWGFDEMSGAAVRLYWATGEAEEAKEAFSEERKPNFSKFRK
jgi:naphthoate synthase